MFKNKFTMKKNLAIINFLFISFISLILLYLNSCRSAPKEKNVVSVPKEKNVVSEQTGQNETNQPSGTTLPSPSFDISDVYPPSLTISKGGEGYFTIQITPQNGFVGDIYFNVFSNDGSVISWLFLTPQSVRVDSGGLTQRFSIKVSPNATTGNYSLKFRASSGTISKEKSFSLNIIEPPSFEISDPDPVSLAVAAGQVGSFELTITPQNGFSGNVSLYIVDRNTDGTIYGISVTPYFVSVTQQVTQVVNLVVDYSVASGYYALKIKVSSGKIAKEKNIDLLVTKFWARAYGSSCREEAFSIQKTKDGGFIVAGYKEVLTMVSPGAWACDPEVWILKLDPAGNVQWQKIFGRTYPYWDIAYEVKEGSDGSFIVVGRSFIPAVSVPSPYHGFIVKLDSNGNFAWSLTYTPSNLPLGSYARFRSLTISQEDGTEYIVVTSGGGGIMKIRSSDGSIVWQKIYEYDLNSSTPNPVRFLSRVITSLYSGSVSYVFLGKMDESCNFLVMITDKDGNIQMSKIYRTPLICEDPSDIKETPDGAFVIVGTANGYEYYDGKYPSNIWVLKIRKNNGEIIWQKAFGGARFGWYDGFSSVWQIDLAPSVLVVENGDIIITGSTRRVIALRLDKDGNLKWQKIYGAEKYVTRVNSICFSNDGYFVAAGFTNYPDPNGDLFVMKITPDGYIKFNPNSPMSLQDSSVTTITTNAIPYNPSLKISAASAVSEPYNLTLRDAAYNIVNLAP
jgi:hypothetical protein